ncbi:hypothetical protein NQ317_013492, partial [Molorchus minor]
MEQISKYQDADMQNIKIDEVVVIVGYIIRNYFLTPLVNPRLQAEQLYNESHIRTRNVIERCFGVWKRRFLGSSLWHETKIGYCITNYSGHSNSPHIAKNMNEPEPPLPEDINQEELNYLIGTGNIEDVPNINENVNESINNRLFFQTLRCELGKYTKFR